MLLVVERWELFDLRAWERRKNAGFSELIDTSIGPPLAHLAYKKNHFKISKFPKNLIQAVKENHFTEQMSLKTKGKNYRP
jgi:hypothetical protein